MIPLAVPNLTGRESKYLQQCIETTFVSSVGPFVTRFEKMVAEAAGGSLAVAPSAGTTGLHAALVAVGVRQNALQRVLLRKQKLFQYIAEGTRTLFRLGWVQQEESYCRNSSA